MSTRHDFKGRTSGMHRDMRRRFGTKIKIGGEWVVKTVELGFTLLELRSFLGSLERQGGIWHCYYCDQLLTVATLELDHKIPRKRGGGLGLDNLAPSCKICNQTKGELTADEYTQLYNGLQTFPMAARDYVLKCLRIAAVGQIFWAQGGRPKREKQTITMDPAVLQMPVLKE